MLRIVYGLLACIPYLPANPQTYLTPVSINYTKALAYSSVHRNAFSFTGNQAALAGINRLSFGLFGERRFLLNDLSVFHLAVVVPASGGQFGLQAVYFGSPAFNQSGVGLAYARNLGKVDVGAQFNYSQLKASGYGSAGAVNFEAGAILHVSDRFQTGVHVYNPTRAAMGKDAGAKLPMVYSFGLGYDASEQFFVGTEIEKEDGRPVNVTTGIQYSFDKKLFARAGIASATAACYLGAGFLWNGLRVDVAVSVHPNLGPSPGMLLLYDSPQKK